MPQVILYRNLAGTIAFDCLSRPGGVDLTALRLPGGEMLALPTPRFVLSALLADAGGGNYRFRSDPEPLTLHASLVFSGKTFFGRAFSVTAGATADVTVQLGAVGGPAVTPFLRITARAAFSINAAGTSFAAVPVDVQFVLEALPAGDDGQPPTLQIVVPDVGLALPAVPSGWAYPDWSGVPLLVTRPAGDVTLGPVTVSWQGVSADLTSDLPRLEVRGVRVTGVGGEIEGDLSLVFNPNGGVDVSASTFAVRFRGSDRLSALKPSHWHFDDECLAVEWYDDGLAGWLSLFLADNPPDVPPGTKLGLRVLRGGDGVRELRLDVTLPAVERAVRLPGFNVRYTPTSPTLLSVVYGEPPEGPAAIAVLLRVNAGDSVAAECDLVLNANEEPDDAPDAERLVLNDPDATDVLFRLTATAKKIDDGASSVALVLMELPIGGRPRFLRQLGVELEPLFSTAEEPPDEDSAIEPSVGTPSSGANTPVDLDTQPVDGSRWKVDATFPLLEQAGKSFRLPLLRRDDAGRNDDVKLGLALAYRGKPTVTLPAPNDPDGVREKFSFVCPLRLELTLGGEVLQADLDLMFEPGRFLFRINNATGVVLKHKSIETELFGLKWTFAPNSSGEMLRLRTASGNYRLELMPRPRPHDQESEDNKPASITIEYAKASADGSEPMKFLIDTFGIGPGGIDLDGAIVDRPVKLNGLNTEFRFAEGKLSIRGNRLQSVHLAGSGALPPKLMGSATVSLALTLGYKDSRLRLTDGCAKLQTTKPLVCRDTRFEFKLDAVEVGFADFDDRIHVYFMISGSARLKLLSRDAEADGLSALEKLADLEIRFQRVPLAGDARALRHNHIDLNVSLPAKVRFEFFKCFKFELRGIGFIPDADVFDDRPAAMQLSGQVAFADVGDVVDVRVDFHKLYLALPEPGGVLPRLHLKRLGVKIRAGDAFALEGEVDFLSADDPVPAGRPKLKGFAGRGALAISGLPGFAATFAFVRVSTDGVRWQRAWFLYLEARHLSLKIPVIEVSIREVGLGFGYRYTLVAIKAADDVEDPRKLLKVLTDISRSQGNLADIDQWQVDPEAQGESPRWTVVLRAMISQTSAATSPFDWNADTEKNLPCLFIMDAVIALRSDLTFLMNVRAWLNTNYRDFDLDRTGLGTRPLLSGFVLLSPRRKRFLAHLESNPNAAFGDHPPLPDFLKKAITNSRFSATLLIEPGLLHYELGWPNMLRWHDKIGPLEADFRGGAIFRLAKSELVIGQSFLARGKLEFNAGIDLKVVGAQFSAVAEVAYGARYIGVLSFASVGGKSAFYGGTGIEINIDVRIDLWIGIKIGWVKIRKTFHFDIRINFTASVEVGILLDQAPGLRGHATLGLRLMGRSLSFGIRLSINSDAVTTALKRVDPFLHVGLEAGEVEDLPGTPTRTKGLAARAATDRLLALHDGNPAEPYKKFSAPPYGVFLASTPDKAYTYVLFLPGDINPENNEPETGFLPVPPMDGTDDLPVEVDRDFEIAWHDEPPPNLHPYDPHSGKFSTQTVGATTAWQIKWRDEYTQAGQLERGLTLDAPTEGVAEPDPAEDKPLSLAQYMRLAYMLDPNKLQKVTAVVPVGDPTALRYADATVEDGRVRNPTADTVEPAVRGAAEQIESSPYLRRDRSLYEAMLAEAFKDNTSVYTKNGTVPQPDPTSNERANFEQTQQALQMRSMIVREMVEHVQRHAAASADSAELAELRKDSLAFRFGLVFRFEGDCPWWTKKPGNPVATLSQRVRPEDNSANSQAKDVLLLNSNTTSFDLHPPQFESDEAFVHESTVALAWRLTWPEYSSDEIDIEDHLAHYRVVRRTVDGSGPERTFLVRPADILHKVNGHVVRLASRFQFVDHFEDEVDADVVALPAEGREYLYTVTPYDVNGQPGATSLTRRVKRVSCTPPAVPGDGILRIAYDVEPLLTKSGSFAPPAEKPTRWEPGDITVTWSLPMSAVEKYWLVFRSIETMANGAYGVDAEAGDGASPDAVTPERPVSNARRLRTDVAVELVDRDTGLDDGRRVIVAKVDLAELQKHGLLPKPGEGEWLPNAWQVFLQTGSVAKVKSSLVPVEIRLEFVRDLKNAAEDRTKRSQRRPAWLEWLPKPFTLGMLPAVDGRIEKGRLAVPQPVKSGCVFGQFNVNAPLSTIGIRPHPDGKRGLAFSWNQTPSADAGTPCWSPALVSGYSLHEFDALAHTSERLDNPSDDESKTLKTVDFDAWADAAPLTKVQEMQVLSSDDAALTPADTRSPARWEAWYPSNARYRAVPPAENQTATPQGSGYGWHNAWLEWPSRQNADMVVVEPGKSGRRVHPLLNRLLRELEAIAPTSGSDDTSTIDLASVPSFEPGTLTETLQALSPTNDPYGWTVLQHMGLSITFALRNARTGAVRTAEELVDALRTALSMMLPTGDPLARHLHVELPFQPARAVRLDATKDAPAFGDLLAFVQVSLRPAVRQFYRFRRLELAPTEGPGKPFKVTFECAKPGGTIFDPAGATTTVIELKPGEAAECTYTPPADYSPVVVFVREPLGASVECKFSKDVEISPIDAFVGTLPTSDQLPEHWRPYPASPTAQATPAMLAWDDFRAYAHVLFAPPTPDKPDAASMPALPDKAVDEPFRVTLAWLQRFFDASGDICWDDDTRIPARTMAGPWTATAYPRALSPVNAAADGNGVLSFVQPVETPWAVARRYLIRLHTRYDLLWEAVGRMTALFAKPGHRTENLKALNRVVPGRDGGLDVVLDRVYPVASPAVLFSGRLDTKPDADGTVRPGRYWQVVVANHAEQALQECNRRLAAVLSFRQIAASLTRHYAFEEELIALNGYLKKNAGGYKVTPLLPSTDWQNAPPLLPERPASPDHLDLQSLDDDDKASIDLAGRLGEFAAGGTVMQWDALPFYWEHRLDLVAQAAKVVSPVTTVTQRDFHYRSPKPKSDLHAVDTADGRERVLVLDLAEHWDCLGSEARKQWAVDHVGTPSIATERGFARLPDLSVRYELIRLRPETGVKEPVSQYVFERDGENSGKFLARQLVKDLQADAITPIPPPAATPADPFRLEIRIVQTTDLPQPDGGRRPWHGDVTPQLRDRQLLGRTTEYELLSVPSDPAELAAFAQDWLPARAVSRPPEGASTALAAKLRWHGWTPRIALAWQGDAGNAAELRAWADRLVEGDLKAAVAKFADAAAGGETEASDVIARQTVDVPPALAGQVWVGVGLLQVRGNPSDDEARELKALYPDPFDARRIDDLLDDAWYVAAMTDPLIEWARETPVSGRAAFADAPPSADGRIAFVPPDGCSLLTWEKLDTAGIDFEAFDQAFGDALQRLAERSPAATPDEPVSTEAGVGPEQIVELSPRAIAPTSAAPRLTWNGAVDESQQAVLERWSKAEPFGPVFAGLLQVCDEEIVTQSFDVAESPPPIPPDLQARLTIPAAGRLAWSALRWSPAEREQLAALAHAGGPTFNTAVDALNAALGGSQGVSVSMPTDWKPRRLPAAWQGRVLLGNGKLRVHGWLTRDEATSLLNVDPQPDEPDQRAVAGLYRATLSAGTGTLVVAARRDNAPAATANVSTRL